MTDNTSNLFLNLSLTSDGSVNSFVMVVYKTITKLFTRQSEVSAPPAWCLSYKKKNKNKKKPKLQTSCITENSNGKSGTTEFPQLPLIVKILFKCQ